MEQRSLDPVVATTLAEARTAIERGDYGQSLRLLEPLAERYPPAGPIGAGVRLLMTTALMGMGDSERATACCRSLQICVDPTLRAKARELQRVLEAPALRRPRQWSPCSSYQDRSRATAGAEVQKQARRVATLAEA